MSIFYNKQVLISYCLCLLLLIFVLLNQHLLWCSSLNPSYSYRHYDSCFFTVVDEVVVVVEASL